MRPVQIDYRLRAAIACRVVVDQAGVVVMARRRLAQELEHLERLAKQADAAAAEVTAIDLLVEGEDAVSAD
jgi:hypothetical protein